jgi:hypothetical protein
MDIKTDRIVCFRQQDNPNEESLKYPYSYLHEYDLTPQKIIGESSEENIDFPSCINHYYWIYEGVNDEVPWRTLFNYLDKNRKTRYGFYIGECDYTGFDCRGSMRLYVSDNLDVLIQKAFTNEDYRLYILETVNVT